jgi:predicted transcriptional regulator
MAVVMTGASVLHCICRSPHAPKEKTSMNDQAVDRDDLLQLTSGIVTAHVAHNSVPLADLPGLIQTVHATLTGLNQPVPEPVQLKPAVNPKKSVTPDHIVCLEDGRKLKMLKRHLRAAYDMTPEQYRAKWGLPYDYPMVAPNYARKRQQLAKKIGLGRKSKTAA